ncbi:hypothetical protein [Nocardia vaccinii]|uniref:hypothetical protein n=1 Tax=Nocardia vaccinii TaxID=1822 RepID=UPI00082F92B5|nr:hypothetical protein [Nocardia vaccinii]
MSEQTVTLTTALGKHPVAQILRSGEVTDPMVRLDFAEVTPIHRVFAPMVREQSFDVCELAVVTALQAIAHGHPIALLPVVVAARFQRECLVGRADDPIDDPAELRGRRIGVRSYTQTTGFWIRSHLREDYGLRAEDMTWLTQNPAHVPEYEDPDFVSRTLSGSLVDALRDGAIDAAIFGNDLPAGDEFVPLISQARQRDQRWYDEHGYVPVNHLVAVSLPTLRTRPEAVGRVWELLTRAEHLAAERATGIPVTASGLSRLTGPIDAIAAECHAQGMLPRPLTSAEVFAPLDRLPAPRA